MREITSREMVLMRRAAEDACYAMNAHYGPFIEVIAKPLKIIALLDLIQSQAAKIDALKTQLNNIEQCYIEKKKQLEDQQR